MGYPLQVQQPNLEQMFGHGSLFNTMYGMQQANNAQANNDQNFAQAQQDMQFQADQHPLDIGKAQADIAHTNALRDVSLAQVPGLQASGRKTTMEADDLQALGPVQRQQVLAKEYAAKASTADLTDLENHVWTEAAKGNKQAIAMIPFVKAVREEHLKQQDVNAGAAAVANIHEAGATSRTDKEIAGGKFNKYTTTYLINRGLTSGNFEQQSGAYSEMARQEAEAARQPDISDEQRAFHQQRAQMAAQLAAAAKQAVYNKAAASAFAALQKSPDLNKLGVPTATLPDWLQPGAGQPAPAPAASAPTPLDKVNKDLPPPVNSKGWKLQKDAKNRMAYVGPNNEIEEVK